MVDTSVGGVGCHLVVVQLADVPGLAFHLGRLVIRVVLIFIQYLAALCDFCHLAV
jgi:hypothetical protein